MKAKDTHTKRTISGYYVSSGHMKWRAAVWVFLNLCFYGVAINSWGVRWLILSLLPSIFIVHGILFWPFILCAPKKKYELKFKLRRNVEILKKGSHSKAHWIERMVWQSGNIMFQKCTCFIQLWAKFVYW